MVKVRDTGKKKEHLECAVLPQFDDSWIQGVSEARRALNPENRIAKFQHRLELLRTIGTCTNTIVSILVLLKVFKVF